MPEERPDVATGWVVPADPPVLTSKLRIPPLPTGLVDRERLRAALDRGVRGPVTLLEAPAGWGKSVLLSSWVAGGVAGPVAWLSVEPGDEGTRFWSYLRAALCGVGVRVGAEHDDEAFLPRLADGLARLAEPVVVVLDDLHQVHDPGVLSGLDFLLRHAAVGLRLVVATRAEPALPLHRWRLRGELTELGVRELSFTADETAELLTRHGLALAAAQADELHARTEGWPAGVRLTALALAQTSVADGQPAGEDARIADYLFEEVLAGQPAELLDALLCTSVPDRMCGGLVAALTGVEDGDGVLAELRRANAFVLPLDTRPAWYRYHRMFGALLRAELSRRAPDRVPDLHRRAAGWLAAHELPVEALRHALAAHDWPLTTSILTGPAPDPAAPPRHWHHLVRYGPGRPGATPAPAPPEDAMRADPELALAYAAERLDRHDLATADGYLRRAEAYRQPLTGDRRDRLALVLAGLNLTRAQLRGDVEEMLATSYGMLGLLELTGDPTAGELATAIAIGAVGGAQLAAGELDSAEAALRDGLARAERADLACLRVVCASELAFVLASRGELHGAEQTARAALRLPPCAGQPQPVYAAYAYLALAYAATHWDRLADAEANLNLAAGLCDATCPPTLLAALAIAQAQVLREQGDLTGGYEVLRAGRLGLGQWRPSRHLEDRLAATEADLRTAHGDTATVRRLLDGNRSDSPPLALALARAYLRDGNPGAASQVLPPWIEEGSRDALAVRLDAGLVEALAARRLGEDRRATRALERVLQLAEPEGFRRVFLRADAPVRELLVEHLDSGTAYWSMVSELIAATGDPPVPDGTPPSTSGEPLTDRERTILRYLQSILSNVEIASELSLSVNTVKTHVRNIYRKLAATGRRDAIRKARELRLL
jgi:LuxR family maltose regulon positive regulatory protein